MEDYKLEKEANNLSYLIDQLNSNVITDLVSAVEELENKIETMSIEHAMEIDDLQTTLDEYQTKYYDSQVERLALLEIIKNISYELELSRQAI